MVTNAYKGDTGILSAWVRKQGLAQPEGVFLFPSQWPELPSLSTVGIQGLSTDYRHPGPKHPFLQPPGLYPSNATSTSSGMRTKNGFRKHQMSSGRLT